MRRYVVALAVSATLVVTPTPAHASHSKTCGASIALPTAAIRQSLDLGVGQGTRVDVEAQRTLTKRLAVAKRKYARAVREAATACRRGVHVARLARNSDRSRANSNADRVFAGARYTAAVTQRIAAREATVYRAFDLWVAQANAAYRAYDDTIAADSVLSARTDFRARVAAAESDFAVRLDAEASALAKSRATARSTLADRLASATTDQDRVLAWNSYNTALLSGSNAARSQHREAVAVLRSALTQARDDYDTELDGIEEETGTSSSDPVSSSEPTSTMPIGGTGHQGKPRGR